MKLVLVAVGQRPPAWADAAFDEYAKRFPPELRLELKAVKAEPRGAKTAAQLMAAEARASRRRCRAARAASRSTSAASASRSLGSPARLLAWQGEGRDAALVAGGPDGLDAALEGELRRDAAPVGPDPCRTPSFASSSPRRSTAPGRQRQHPYHRE